MKRPVMRPWEQLIMVRGERGILHTVTHSNSQSQQNVAPVPTNPKYQNKSLWFNNQILCIFIESAHRADLI